MVLLSQGHAALDFCQGKVKKMVTLMYGDTTLGSIMIKSLQRNDGRGKPFKWDGVGGSGGGGISFCCKLSRKRAT